MRGLTRGLPAALLILLSAALDLPTTEAEPNGAPLVTGRVLMPDGSPAAGVEVHLRWAWQVIPPIELPVSFQSLRARGRMIEFLTPVRADEEGRYTFFLDPESDEVPPLRDTLRVCAWQGELLGNVLSAPGEDLPLAAPDLRLEPGMRVAVRLTDEEGEPVRDVECRLRARREDDDEHRLLRRVTDAEGRASFTPVRRRGDWVLALELDHPKHPLVRTEIDPADVLAEKEAKVTLPTACVLRGTVLLPPDVPVEGVQVVPAQKVEGEWRPVYSRTDKTDGKGRFEIAGVPAGTLRLWLYPGLEHPAGSKGAWGVEPQVRAPFRARPGEELDLGEVELEPWKR